MHSCRTASIHSQALGQQAKSGHEQDLATWTRAGLFPSMSCDLAETKAACMHSKPAPRKLTMRSISCGGPAGLAR